MFFEGHLDERVLAVLVWTWLLVCGCWVKVDHYFCARGTNQTKQKSLRLINTNVPTNTNEKTRVQVSEGVPMTPTFFLSLQPAPQSR